uniref:Uncharacterized protein n=1 Tax=Avena sativa TaxID=4498 RepID=A0ACD5TD90_AVESA
MKDCITLDDNMAAPSLERLSMTWCELPEEHRNSISLPSLVHLELIECFGRLPVLESLPSLETGIVRLGENSGDQCFRSVRGCYTYSPCQDCHFAIDFAIARGRSYFFEGLSRATHLELSSPFEYALIFQRDLSWCPTFPMLKTLVLDDWCLDDDLSAVILFIQQSPNLEKLTLELFEVFDSLMVREGSYYHPWKGTFASDHLKMVEIKCEEFDERVKKVLKILSTFGISLEKIHIRLTDTSSGSECFHFVCTGFSHS